jgi:hypothetical protein
MFGSSDERFMTVAEALSTLVLILFGAFEPDAFGSLAIPPVGRAFLWAYLLLAYLIMLNLLLAIIIDAYILAKGAAGDEPSLASVAADAAFHLRHEARKLALGASAQLGDLVSARLGGWVRARNGAWVRQRRAPPVADARGAEAAWRPGHGSDRLRVEQQPSAFFEKEREEEGGMSLLPPCRVALSAERRDELLHALSSKLPPADDGMIARALLGSTGRLLTKGPELPLRELTELFGAVGATRVMARYGHERPAAMHARARLPALGFEARVAQALRRIDRGVDRVRSDLTRTRAVDGAPAARTLDAVVHANVLPAMCVAAAFSAPRETARAGTGAGLAEAPPARERGSALVAQGSHAVADEHRSRAIALGQRNALRPVTDREDGAGAQAVSVTVDDITEDTSDEAPTGTANM